MSFARKFRRRANKSFDLIGFYYGYKANQGLDGFEFTDKHCRDSGMDRKTIAELGRLIYDTAKEQADYIKSNITKEEKEKYILEEQARLEQAVRNMAHRCSVSTLPNNNIDFYEALPDIMMACCAITTLVASGHLKQDEYNGHSFLLQERLQSN